MDIDRSILKVLFIYALQDVCIKEKGGVIVLADYLYTGVRYAAAVIEMGFLYAWLSAFLKGRKTKEKVKELEKAKACLEMEAKHYQNMDSLHEQYDVFIHDMKHTMRTIAALSEEGECEKISRLIDKMGLNIGNIEQEIICSNKILNALLAERKGYAADNGIMLEMEIREPLNFHEIDDLDLVALVGNLLDNAIEAEKRSGERAGILLCMRTAREGRHIVIQLENSYDENRNDRKMKIVQNEQIGKKHGIGLGSIRDIVRKYGGIIENEKRDGRYIVKVILPVQSEWEGRKPYAGSAHEYLQLLSK